MVSEQDLISARIKIEVESAKIDGAMKKLSAFKQQINTLRQAALEAPKSEQEIFKKNIAMMNSNLAIRREEIAKKKMQLAINSRLLKQQERMYMQTHKFKAEFLSIMFFGMAIQRVFGGFLRTAFQTFQRVTEGTTLANNETNRLAAAWEFLKFSLISALMDNPVFGFFIDWLIRAINWFNNLSESTKGWVAAAIGAAALIGGALMGIGTIVLGFSGLNKLLADAKDIGPQVRAAVGVIALTFALKQAKDAFSEIEDGKFSQGILDAISASFAAIGAAKMFSKGKGGIGYIVIAVTLELTQHRGLVSKIVTLIAAIEGIIVGAFEIIGRLAYRQLYTTLLSPFLLLVNQIINAFSAIPGMSPPPWLTDLEKALRSGATSGLGEINAREIFTKNIDKSVKTRLEQFDLIYDSVSGAFDKLDSFLSSKVGENTSNVNSNNTIYLTQNISTLAGLNNKTSEEEQLSRYGYGQYYQFG